MEALTQITRMNGKPVFEVPAKSVINFKSGFGHKLLCDGLTFSAGSACAYSCTFCYVTDLMRKSPHLENVRAQYSAVETEKPFAHSEVVIRRAGVLNAMRSVLAPRGKAKFTDPQDNRVLYMSPLVDVAANPELIDETVEACKVILGLTHWQIRMLSKSSFLPRIARRLDAEPSLKAKERVIYGVSTGTLDNKLAASFEQGTALVSKRLESLHWLQDQGFRTFGMICPSLPMPSSQYNDFAREMGEAVRVDRCEHVWAEVMNVRGESFTRTEAALRVAGYDMYADLLKMAAEDKGYWEEYSRLTFLAHTRNIPATKLRFLQYVNASNRSWWSEQVCNGAVLL